jgi:LuxR family maltose regulon positive regulatory protein
LAGISTARLAQARLRQAKGDLEGALEILDSPAQALQKGSFIDTAARQIQVRLALGDVEGVSRWAATLMHVLGGGAGAPRLPLVAVEAVRTILARVALARGEIERALQLLDQVQASAEAGRRWGCLIEVYLLRALAWQKQHNAPVPPEALEDLQRALALAEPEGYVLLFLETGPAVRPLLHAVAQRDAAPEQIRAYARRLLDAFPIDADAEAASSAEPPPVAPGLKGMIEPLTPRELEVLQFLAEGLTYQEIAERLVLSLNTVRFHVKNLYGKLEAGKRAEAVDRARTLGLL